MFSGVMLSEEVDTPQLGLNEPVWLNVKRPSPEDSCSASFPSRLSLIFFLNLVEERVAAKERPYDRKPTELISYSYENLMRVVDHWFISDMPHFRVF